MNRRGLFTFTLVLALVPLYLTLADFENEKITQETFTESVLMELERSNYQRTELEINTDDIVAETLLFYLSLEQGKEAAALLDIKSALASAGLEILGADSFEDQAQKVIAARLLAYYSQQEQFQWQGLEKLLDFKNCSHVKLDTQKNSAQFTFKCRLEASINSSHVRQKFKLPQEYTINVKGVI